MTESVQKLEAIHGRLAIWPILVLLTQVNWAVFERSTREG